MMRNFKSKIKKLVMSDKDKHSFQKVLSKATGIMQSTTLPELLNATRKTIKEVMGVYTVNFFFMEKESVVGF